MQVLESMKAFDFDTRTMITKYVPVELSLRSCWYTVLHFWFVYTNIRTVTHKHAKWFNEYFPCGWLVHNVCVIRCFSCYQPRKSLFRINLSLCTDWFGPWSKLKWSNVSIWYIKQRALLLTYLLIYFISNPLVKWAISAFTYWLSGTISWYSVMSLSWICNLT